MPDVKVFMTGATGYIGGDFLHLLHSRHPDWKVSCLARGEAKPAAIQAAYPNVRIVRGTLDDEALIEEEASEAHIIYHFANSDHVKSARAIARGLARNRSMPAYWIHTSGAGILTYDNFAQERYGYALDTDKKVYNDMDGVTELTSMPDKAIHRHVDKIVLATSRSAPDRIKTAIVSPSCIYGLGRGTGNRNSVQVNVAARLALQRGKAVQVGDGTSFWHGVHVHDLSELYLILGESAQRDWPYTTWGERGYYLAEDCSFYWGDVTRAIAREAKLQGYIETSEVESVEFEQALKIDKRFPYLCGTTSKGLAKRAKALLDWKPTRHGMMEDIPNVVREEAENLGLFPRRRRDSVL